MLKQKPWLRTILILLGVAALVAVGFVVGYQVGRASVARDFTQLDGAPGAFLQNGDGQDLPEGFQATAEAFREQNGGQGLPGDQGGAANLRGQQPGALFGGSLLPWLIAGGLLVLLLAVVLVLAFRPSPDAGGADQQKS